jgi:hypothetical protein
MRASLDRWFRVTGVPAKSRWDAFFFALQNIFIFSGFIIALL